MVTLADVARHAGVSASTVSYVLSGKRSISRSTRERVERSIEELGYRPHAGARALASNRSGIIALMVPLRTDIYVPVMLQIAMAVTTTARAHGYDVLLLTGEEGPEAVRRIEGSAVADAMIVMDVELDDERLPLLRTARRPAVLIGLPADAGGLGCVDLDFAAAGALCVEHLAGLGHREIAFIGEAPGVYERHTGFAERTLAGLRSAAGTHDMRLLHRPCASGWTAVAATLGRILEERPGTTAFVVQNEAATDPLLALLRQQRLAVPEDVSVVAICPDQVAAQASVPLTAVAVPAQDMGRRAVEQVVAVLDGGETAGTVLLAPELTVRASSGPAPR
ncbi:LacI family DNA-binding transcriptional regulator [Streptomyces pristinaespiralis]|uniref:Transcriptional regulator n=2 Tax=Streptomyces pristinaespiralis TaxID=38300 RepID=B5HJV9_STRE2|nr:LacI family DNA-binding transcriptional regulator [Streptomyces pristinaespiralis]EDY67120.1 transcriptional regulator [Streptomyces pristinaespiralis ATCC 25486]QMU17733.1 LacI family DNA-binding transcriptional regulator [Streptomyces pristinaespiralis]